MREVTLQIKQLFALISAYERVKFIPEQEQFLNSDIQIKDETDNWVTVNAAITKESNGRKVAFDTNEYVSGADKHLIFNGRECVYLDSLQPGDVLTKQDGSETSVVSISEIDDTLFYDLSVLSKTHLYQTSNGFVHHNTELAKQLSSVLGMKLLRFDMSEYQEKHTISKLIGAPPGYVGFEDSTMGGGLLINEVDKNPNSVILLDEIEKAHPDLMSILLPAMDDGRLTGSNGKTVNLNNTIIILTSNLGARDMERNTIGFGQAVKTDDDDAVQMFFAPEFRNRLDAVIKFNTLDKDNIKMIASKFINQLKDRLKEKKITIKLDNTAWDYLVANGYDPKMGARPMNRLVERGISLPLSREILFGSLSKGGSVQVKAVDNKLVFAYNQSENESEKVLVNV